MPKNKAFIIKDAIAYEKFTQSSKKHTVNKTLERYKKYHKNKKDVCEWNGFDNSLDENMVDWVYETTCGQYVSENHTSSAFKFCPYCGKEINLV